VRVLLVALLLAGAAAAEGESRLGSLIRWYLREESPARKQDLLEEIDKLAGGDPRPVADAIRKGEHFERPEKPELAKGGKPPVFDTARPRLLPVDGCAGDFAELVLPERYDPSRAHPLQIELAALGLPPPADTVVLRVRLGAYAQAVNPEPADRRRPEPQSVEAAELFLLSLLAHVFDLVNVDPRRVLLVAGEREEAALAWCIALHNPDRFAGVIAGPSGWKGALPLASNAALFSGVAIVSHKGDRGYDAFFDELRRWSKRHVRLEETGDRDQNRVLLWPTVEKWMRETERPSAPPRIRLVDDRKMALRAYWLRLAPRVPSDKPEDVGRAWRQQGLAQDATLEAEFKEKDRIDVRAERVAAFDIFIDPALLEPGGVVRVSVNGQVPEARVARGDIGVLLDDYANRRDPDLLYLGKLTFTAR
jgi:hypothetical protein